MADSKNNYSRESKKYTNNTTKISKNAQKSYNVSKEKENKYGNSWEKVNINEIVDKFAPNAKEYVNGYKYIFEGDKYDVIADMVSGSLRIINKATNQPLKLDGKPGSKKDTHFKIKKVGKIICM